jgi:hypothetical protein
MAKRPDNQRLPVLILSLVLFAGVLPGCEQAKPDTTPASFFSGEILEPNHTDQPAPDESGMLQPATPTAPGISRAVTQEPEGAAGLAATERAIFLVPLGGNQTRRASGAGQEAGGLLTATAPDVTPAFTATPAAAASPGSVHVDVFRSVAPVDATLPGRIVDLRAGPEEVLWVLSESGVASLHGKVWTVHFSDEEFLLAGFDAAGRMWMVNEQGTAAWSWDGTVWQVFCETEGWTPVQTPASIHLGEDLLTDLSGRVWMTTGQDVRMFDGRVWEVYSLEEMGFEADLETAASQGFSLPALAMDHVGRVWVGDCDFQGEVNTGQGARWFDGENWQGVDVPTDSGCVQDIAVDQKGRVWLGIDEVLWRFDPASKEWASFKPPEAPSGDRFDRIVHIAFGSDGEPWPALKVCGGASCGGFEVRYHLRKDTWTQIGKTVDYLSEGFYFDPAGTPWLYSAETLYRVVGDNLEPISGLKVSAVTQDSTGRLWIAAEYQRQTLVLREELEGE